MKIKIERLFIPGPAGRLEALLEWDAETSPRMSALVCHPHPLYGGTIHNKVVFRAAKAAVQTGLPAVRFNFRGAGKSEGKFADGIGEREDVQVALNFLDERFPGNPICLIGFSFGSWVGLPIGGADSRVIALVGLGIPTRAVGPDFLREVTKPKLVIQGTEDQFGPQAEIEALFADLLPPKRLHLINGVDHFFAGKLDEVQSIIRDFLREIQKGNTQG